MGNSVYKKIEVTGTSDEGLEDAIRSAVVKAGESLHNLRWFEVSEIRGSIAEGDVKEWQVTVKIGFRLD